ncbi:hypothetical protein LSAT2_029073 [Lamellibrachia satsuma]|nr:hypothetical protein LSAT2_029073 [Lamellibrachia satsuma]
MIKKCLFVGQTSTNVTTTNNLVQCKDPPVSRVKTMQPLLVVMGLMSSFDCGVDAALSCRPTDCAQLQCYSGHLGNGGPYMVYPDNGLSVYANCVVDEADGGWTVMQRRKRGDIKFDKLWHQYKLGFGFYGPDAETWLGNEHVYRMSTKKRKELTLRIDAASYDNKTMTVVMERVALLGEERDYMFLFNGSEWWQGVSTNDFRLHNKHIFSTSDHDNSVGGWASYYGGGGGWWFRNGTKIYLNGEYSKKGNVSGRQYMTAVSFAGLKPLKSCRMMIRSSGFTTVAASCTNPCQNGGSCRYMPYVDRSVCFCTQGWCGDKCQSQTGCNTMTTATTTYGNSTSKDVKDDRESDDTYHEKDGATSHVSFYIAIVIMAVIIVSIYGNACRVCWKKRQLVRQRAEGGVQRDKRAAKKGAEQAEEEEENEGDEEEQEEQEVEREYKEPAHGDDSVSN